MFIAIYIAIGFIIFLAYGLIKQALENSYLINELSKYNDKKLLSTTHSIESKSEKYEILVVSESDLIDAKSLTRRLMKKCGIQKLPCLFWLSEEKTINSEVINEGKIIH